MKEKVNDWNNRKVKTKPFKPHNELGWVSDRRNFNIINHQNKWK